MLQSTENAKYDLLVVGAGVSGLSLAHLAARQGRTVLVVERATTPGGCVRSAKTAEQPAGGEQSGEAVPFWLELGAHTLYNSYVNLIGLLEACGLRNKILEREKLGFFLLVDGKLRTIPSQLRIPELLVSVPRLLFTSRAGQSIRSYYSHIVGQGNFDRVFRALFNAVACQDTSEFGVDHLFKKRPGRRKDIRRSFTLAGGLGTFIEALATTPGLVLETGAGAVSVSREGGAFKVRLADGVTHCARVLALATPPNQAAALLEGCFPDISEHLSQIRVNHLYSVGVAIGREKVSLPPLAGIVSAGDTFYSVVSRDVVDHPECRGFTFHFQKADTQANIRRVEQVLGVEEAQFDRVEIKENEIPTLGVRHADLVRHVDNLAAGRNLLLTGNYFLGLSLEDCVARSVSEVGKLGDMLR